MFLTEVAAGIVDCIAASKPIKALGADIRSASQKLTAMRRQRSEPERYLDDSADRFELERRERAWIRCSDGSLLGR